MLTAIRDGPALKPTNDFCETFKDSNLADGAITG